MVNPWIYIGAGCCFFGTGVGAIFLIQNISKKPPNNEELSSIFSFNKIPKTKRKYFPFSSEEKPKKYDHYFLLNSKTSDSDLYINKQDLELNDQWTCTVQGSSSYFQSRDASNGVICHFFKVDQSKAFACPENLENLELLSFESVNLLTDLPNYFLLAIKLLGSDSASQTNIRSLDLYKGNSTASADQFLKLTSSSPKPNLFKTCPENNNNNKK